MTDPDSQSDGKTAGSMPSLECPRCGLNLEGLLEGQSREIECPACGLRYAYEDNGASTSILRRYFRDLGRILVHPVRFFRRVPLRGGLAGPLTFALVTHWIGKSIDFLWSNVPGRTQLMDSFLKYSPQFSDVDHPGRRATLERFRERAQEWMSGMSSVMVDPFKTLIMILVTGFFVYIGARILVPQQDGTARPAVTYESAVRIVAFGLTPAILAVFPFAGSALSNLLIAIYTVIGAREVYRIGTGRAIAVGLFPHLLVLGVALGFFFLAFYLVTQLIFSFV